MKKYIAEIVIEAIVTTAKEEDVWDCCFDAMNMSNIKILDVEGVQPLKKHGNCSTCDVDNCVYRKSTEEVQDDDGDKNSCGKICTDCGCRPNQVWWNCPTCSPVVWKDETVVNILPETDAFNRARWLKAYRTLTAKRF